MTDISDSAAHHEMDLIAASNLAAALDSIGLSDLTITDIDIAITDDPRFCSVDIFPDAAAAVTVPSQFRYTAAGVVVSLSRPAPGVITMTLYPTPIPPKKVQHVLEDAIVLELLMMSESLSDWHSAAVQVMEDVNRFRTSVPMDPHQIRRYQSLTSSAAEIAQQIQLGVPTTWVLQSMMSSAGPNLEGLL